MTLIIKLNKKQEAYIAKHIQEEHRITRGKVFRTKR